MPQVGLEPTIPVFERAKTSHALDRASTVTGFYMTNLEYKQKHTNKELTNVQ
jgi:hypothetical protein